MALSLTACGGGEKPGGSASSSGRSSGSAGDSASAPDVPELDKSEAPDRSVQQPDKSQPAASEPQQPPKPAVSAEMTYTFDAATGTLTCSGGGEINIDDWVEVVKNTIFETDGYKCRKEVKKAVIEDGITALGEEAFGATAITEIIIPDSVTRIVQSAFHDTQITSVSIPDSVTELGGSIFAYCPNLSRVTLPQNLTVIPERMFIGCTSLTSIQIPESVTTIEKYAFSKCGLTSVTIPDGVMSIGDFAFEECPLTQLTLPSSVTDWKPNALRYCNSLTDLTFLGDTDVDHVKKWVDNFLGEKTITIHAPAGSVIEGYVNCQISENGAACKFAPIG